MGNNHEQIQAALEVGGPFHLRVCRHLLVPGEWGGEVVEHRYESPAISNPTRDCFHSDRDFPVNRLRHATISPAFFFLTRLTRL